MDDPSTQPGRDLDATAEVPATLSTRKLADVIARYTAGETAAANSAAQFFDTPGVTDSIRALTGMDSMGLAADAVLTGRDSALASSAEMYRQLSGDAATRIGGAFTEKALGGITDSYHDATSRIWENAAAAAGIDSMKLAGSAAELLASDYMDEMGLVGSSAALRELTGASSLERYALRDDVSDIVRARDVLAEIPHHTITPVQTPDPLPVAREQLEETRGLRQDVAALASAVSLLVNYTESNGTEQGNWNIRMWVLTLIAAMIAAATFGATVALLIAGG